MKSVVSRRLVKKISIVLLLAALLVSQYAAFRHYVLHCISPFYPGRFDQLQYINFAYKIFYIAQTDSWTSEFLKTFETLNPMRGFVSPMLGALFAIVLGPTRLSVSTVNFVAFAIAETSLLLAFDKKTLTDKGVLAAGLFLLCYYTHYLGSMTDFRLDYVAMMFMGLTYLCATQWLQTGSKRALLLFSLSALFMTCTRSVTIFYFTAAVVLCSVVFMVKQKVSKKIDPYLNRAGIMFAALAGVFTIYFTVFWRDFLQYYVRCKASGECSMAQRMFGTTNLLTSLGFYFLSFASHYLVPLLMLVLIVIVLNRSKGVRSVRTLQSGIGSVEFPAAILSLTLLISVVSFATFFAPNDFVLGVVAVPTCYLSASLFSLIYSGNWWKRERITAAAIVLMLGISLYMKEMYAPFYCIAANYKPATQLLEDCTSELSNSSNRDEIIFWCWPHDGLNSQSFEVYLREHAKRPLIARIKQIDLPPFPEIGTNQLMQYLETSTIIAAPITLPPVKQFTELDGNRSVRKNFDILRTYIDKHFALISKRLLPTLGNSPTTITLGLYRRVK